MTLPVNTIDKISHIGDRLRVEETIPQAGPDGPFTEFRVYRLEPNPSLEHSPHADPEIWALHAADDVKVGYETRETAIAAALALGEEI